MSSPRQLTHISSGRIYIRHGPLKKKWNNSSFKYKDHKKYLFVLFNDILLYAERPRATDFCTLKHIIPLRKIHLKDLPDTPELNNAWVISGDNKTFTVYAPTPIEKQEWMSDLSFYASKAASHSDMSKSLNFELNGDNHGKALSRSV
jgi:hypothetical protein